jgi:site-specific recombinase XerC
MKVAEAIDRFHNYIANERRLAPGTVHNYILDLEDLAPGPG